jgi:hypothetical protein
LSRHEARLSRRSSAIGLMQQGNFAMTKLDNGVIATDIDAEGENAALSAQGYTIRHIETWLDHDATCILWDTPEITETDLPF